MDVWDAIQRRVRQSASLQSLAQDFLPLISEEGSTALSRKNKCHGHLQQQWSIDLISTFKCIQIKLLYKPAGVCDEA